MNTQGCPSSNVFTDELFRFPPSNSVLICSESVALWLGLAIPLVIARSWLFVVQACRESRQRTRKNQNAPTQRKPSRQRDIPFFLLSQAGVTIMLFLIVTLTSLNLANTRNGISFLLLGLYFGFCSMGHFIMIRSVIKLGRKIIPLSGKHVNGGKGTTGQHSQMVDGLQRADRLIKTMWVIGFSSAVTCVLVLCATVSPSTNSLMLFQIGFGALAIYQFMATGTIVYQFQRCVVAVKAVQFSEQQRSDQHNESSSAGTSAGRLAIGKAIWTMRFQQIMTLVIGVVFAILSVLFAMYQVPFSYIAFLVMYLLFETIFQLFLNFPDLVHGCFGKKRRRNLDIAANGASGSKRTLFTSGGENTTVASNANTTMVHNQNSLIASSAVEDDPH